MKIIIMKKINGGVYLVADPAPGAEQVLPKIKKALAGGLAAIQLWNHWQPGQDKLALVRSTCELASVHQVPVLIHEDWALLQRAPLDGVHFDVLPPDLGAIRRTIGRSFICGVTCGNDLELVQQADEQGFDYLSFCSMFPSPSAGNCTIVSPGTISAARRLTSLPIFLAGGITTQNITSLTGTGMSGVALVSAIMKAEDPEQAVRAFREKLDTQTKDQ